MTQLISMAPVGQPLDDSLLDQPGAFLWWYADMLDAQGNGVVLIWSYGLPFLPGLAQRARLNIAQRPSERPSLNVCIYKEHELDFYMLQEYDPEDVHWEKVQGIETWRFGQTTFTRQMRDGQLSLEAIFNAPIAGSAGKRLEGTFHLSGVMRADGALAQDIDPHHDWTPLMAPCNATLDVRCDGVQYGFAGRGYHDRNSGTAPLHELGFSHWVWGRVPLADQDLIYYVLWPQDGDRTQPVCLGLLIDEDGTTHHIEDLSIELGATRLSLAGGLVWHKEMTLYQRGHVWAKVQVQSMLDEGPFYLRYMTTVEHEHQRAHGFGEFCRPNKVDSNLYRPLVNMRVGRQQDNSMWLPLFTGPKKGRLRRMFTQLLVARR